MEVARLRALMPRPVVALPWGSRSTTKTRYPSSARAAPRLTAVVVLPTPPFWLATAMKRGSGRATAVGAVHSGVGGGSGGARSTDAEGSGAWSTVTAVIPSPSSTRVVEGFHAQGWTGAGVGVSRGDSKTSAGSGTL